MQEAIASLIKNTAAQVRARDFIWTAGISAGIGVVVLVGLSADWRVILFTWVAFLASLAVRYRLSSGRAWAQPVQRMVDIELDAQRAELANLRIARGVAMALPEPLFIVGADGVVEHANPAAEALTGVTEIEGRHFASVLRAPDVFEAAESVIETGEARTVDFVTMGSVELSCRAFIAPLQTGSSDETARPTRSLIFVRDLTSERRLEQMRADFIASASHELRTPLASLLGFIETLRGHARKDPEAQEKFLAIMQSQAERMQRLVADLMSLSRIELNEHVPPKEVVELSDVAADVVDSFAPIFEKYGTIADLSIEPDADLRIIGDHDEIFQAIQNLLDNAVKYSGETAMVKVSVGSGAAPALSKEGAPGHRAGDSAAQVSARSGVPIDQLVYVQIRDFGPGIERSDLPRLTERFYRVSIDSSRKSGGTGLGLAIVKHIINRHKGGFQIESQLAGGTAFSCYFAPMTLNRGAEQR